MPRLRRFSESYPHTVIGLFNEGGPWQARIPEGNGETVVTRYLLDRLAVLLGAPDQTMSSHDTADLRTAAGTTPAKSPERAR